MQEQIPSFSLESFKTEMEALQNMWKENWSKTLSGSTNGPMKIWDRDRESMSEEKLAAWEPEQTAMEAVIDYAANAIASATRNNQEGEVIDILPKTFDIKAMKLYYSYILPEIMKRTVRLLTISKEEDPGETDVLKSLTSDSANSTLE